MVPPTLPCMGVSDGRHERFLNDGAVVVPIELVASVAEAGVEQERFERFVQRRVKAGASVLGLYPPDAAALAAYEEWVTAGEPDCT